MKPIKFLALALSLVAITFGTQAQQRVKVTPILNQGQGMDFSGTPGNPLDSLQVSDSIAYIIQVTHSNVIVPYFTWEWTKIGAGSATITLSFLQSGDGITYFPMKTGYAQATYTKTYSTIAASTPYEVNMISDSATFTGRYLKIYYITSATASVKGKIHGRIRAIAR